MRIKANTHPLVKIKLIRAITGHRRGAIIVRRKGLAETLVERGIAEYLEVKQEEPVIETKQEKFIPENKAEPIKTEPADYSETSVRQLGDIITGLSEDDLLNIVKTDERVSAVRLAKNEIVRREQN